MTFLTITARVSVIFFSNSLHGEYTLLVWVLKNLAGYGRTQLTGYETTKLSCKGHMKHPLGVCSNVTSPSILKCHCKCDLIQT